MFSPIKNKRVVLTGATKGIGRGIAQKFAEQGAKLLLINRDEKAAVALKEKLESVGCEAFVYSADVSSAPDMEKAAAFAKEALDGIDIVCANAGIYPSATLESMTVSDWDEVCGVNLKGTFLTVKSFLPLLKEAEYGRVVLTSSITGPVTGFPGWSHYGATKAGQLGFMRTAALELAQHGITVNAVLPGNVMTEGLEELGEQYIEEMRQSIPMKKIGSVEDIANAALFLASKEAGYITGQTLIVDGGQILPESKEALL